jgi:hypothetical protein
LLDDTGEVICYSMDWLVTFVAAAVVGSLKRTSHENRDQHAATPFATEEHSPLFEKLKKAGYGDVEICPSQIFVHGAVTELASLVG